MREFRQMDRSECFELLAANRFGRLAVAMGGGQPPMIRPVNYVFDERSHAVTFRTAAGSKHHALLAAHQAAFEIDGVDPQNRLGWSVVLRGVAEEITDPRELRRLATAPLDP